MKGVIFGESKIFEDERGLFFEGFNLSSLNGFSVKQSNYSISKLSVFRGFHFQAIKPQAKLVRCLQGVVLDICFPIRRGIIEPHIINLDRPEKFALVPRGWAHGFYVTSGPATVNYLVDEYYDPSDEYTIDVTTVAPYLGDIEIERMLIGSEVSEKDRRGMTLAEAVEVLR